MGKIPEKKSGRSPSLKTGLPLPAAAIGVKTETHHCQLPWRGQLPPELAEALLRECAPVGGTVLDPFMGRGAVLVEAVRLGMGAYGCEINPAAFLPARLCELSRLNPSRRQHLLEQVVSLPVMRQFKFLLNGKLFSSTGGHPIGSGDKYCATPSTETTPPANDLFRMESLRKDAPELHLLTTAILVLMDEVAKNRKRQAERWNEIIRMIEDLPWTTSPVRAFLQDARHIPLPEGSVDVVLSAPPGVNAGDYGQISSSVMEQTGWNLRGTARAEIGSSRRFRQNAFLGVLQYCMDMALVLNELQRVCHQRSQLILVVRHQSIIHRTPFFNATIVGRIATGITGMTVQRTQKWVSGERCGRSDRHDLLYLLPTGSYQPDTTGIMERARAIGQDMLSRTIPYSPLSSRILLEQALIQAGNVQPSPRLNAEQTQKKADKENKDGRRQMSPKRKTARMTDKMTDKPE